MQSDLNSTSLLANKNEYVIDPKLKLKLAFK